MRTRCFRCSGSTPGRNRWDQADLLDVAGNQVELVELVDMLDGLAGGAQIGAGLVELEDLDGDLRQLGDAAGVFPALPASG
jgi:hypothetical protein